MARLPTSQTSQLQAPPTNLPYHSHPIYHLRKCLFIIALIGVFMCFFSSDPYNVPVFLACVFFLAVSFFFVFCDLTAYALKKAQNPDEKPEWPRVIFMIGDVCLSVILQIAFWAAIAALEIGGPYCTAAPVWGAYGALTALLCSLLHGYSFWKELMARLENRLLRRLSMGPCPRCGYHDEEESPTSESTQYAQPPNTFTYTGPSAVFQQSNTRTPTSEESTMEEGLLIGSDFIQNYGAAGPSEPTIGQPEEVVVAKGKKKRAVEGSGKAGNARE